MEICEVCDRQFRVLNLNHLRTHGVVSWDQYREMVAQRTKPDQTLIREVAHSLLHKQEVAEDLQQRLARLQAAAQVHGPAMDEAALMRIRLRRINLMDDLQQIDGLVFNMDRAAEYTFEQLVELSRLYGADILKTTQLLADKQKDKGGTPFGDAVGQVVNSQYNQYNFVTANGSATKFDDRLPKDPRAVTGLLQKVEELLGVMRSGVQPVLEERVLEVDAISSDTIDARAGQ